MESPVDSRGSFKTTLALVVIVLLVVFSVMSGSNWHKYKADRDQLREQLRVGQQKTDSIQRLLDIQTERTEAQRKRANEADELAEWLQLVLNNQTIIDNANSKKDREHRRSLPPVGLDLDFRRTIGLDTTRSDIRPR